MRRKPKEQAGGVLRGYKRCPACGKWCYGSRADAQSAVRQRHPGVTVHYYWCEPPGEQRWWHFTSMTAEQEKAIKEQKARERQQPPG